MSALRTRSGGGGRAWLALVVGLAIVATLAGSTGGAVGPAGVDDAASGRPGAETAGTLPAHNGAQPNMVLVIVCTMVYDHLSAAGYEHGTTPFLDDVASRGAFFENAVSASSWTQPAATSILTGLSPNVHRMVVYHPTGAVARRQVEPERVLSSHVTTLAECLADAGYDTFSRINNVQAGDFFNIPQGFDDQLTDWRMRTPGMISDLDRWLEERQSDRPFLALLLTRDAHLVYRPSYEHYRRVSESPVAREAYRGHPRRVYEAVKGSIAAGELPERELRRQFVSLYDGALAQLDADLAELDRLLERRGLTDTTVLAITGDHGERFFERGRIGHAHWLDEATVHVPLILSGPGVPKGQRYDTVVSTMDLFPTLATMAGATSPAAVQGVDLGPLLRGRPEAPRSVFASFTRDKTVLHMVRLGPYKLHMDADGGLELYNVAADPLEQENLIRVEPRTAKRLEVELDRWLDREREMRAAIPESTEERVLTPEMIEQLRALGYLE